MELRKKKKLIYWGIVIIAGIAAHYFFGWLIFHKPAFRGKVIDAETKEAIAGAVVMVFYFKYPLISGPAGGSRSIVRVKETLTDKQGEFYFPAYTTIIQPLAYESHTELMIYKPGYGCYPQLQVSPPYSIGPETFFSKKRGTKEEIPYRSHVVSVTYGVVELPRLKTREERLNAIPGTPGGTRSKELPLFYKAINEEGRRFGLGEVR